MPTTKGDNMKSVKLTKKQYDSLKAHLDRERGLGMGLEALSHALRKASDDLWKEARMINPKVKKIDWPDKCIWIDE